MLRQSRNGLYKNQSIYILHSLMSMMLFMAHIVVGLKVAAEFRLNRRSAEIKDLKKKATDRWLQWMLFILLFF